MDSLTLAAELRELSAEFVTDAEVWAARCRQALTRAAEAIERGVPEGWRDISTAPKDGTAILALIDGVVHQVAFEGPSDGAIYAGSHGRYNWFSDSDATTHHDRSVTHWQPLPSSPSPARDR